MNDKAKVIPMNTSNLDSDSLTNAYALAMAALKSVETTIGKIEAAREKASDAWSAKLKKATARYRDRIREDYEAIVGKDVDVTASGKATARLREVYAGRYVETVADVAERDQIENDKKSDMAKFKQTLAKFTTAKNECLSVHAKSTTQVDMFAPPDAGAVAGLEWSTPAGREAIYTSLRGMEEDGLELDPLQAQLMVDLAGVGLEAMDLGLAAAEAVEEDEDGEEEEADELDDEDDDDMGLD